MSDYYDQISNQFMEWMALGQGALPAMEDAIDLEPPFRPFLGYKVKTTRVVDDGRRPSFFSRLLGAPESSPKRQTQPEIEEPEGLDFHYIESRHSLVELRLSIPADFSASPAAFHQFLKQLGEAAAPISVEFVATAERIFYQLAVGERDADMVEGLLRAYFPQVVVARSMDGLQSAWGACESCESEIFECALTHPFFLPLWRPQIDPAVGLIGALSQVARGETAVVQVMFQHSRHDWQASLRHHLFDEDITGRFFTDHASHEKAAQAKASESLYPVVLRLAAKSFDYDRLWRLLIQIASAFRVYCDPNGNEFVPVRDDDYDPQLHEADLLLRQSRRFGMLLTQSELASLIQMPSPLVVTPTFERLAGNTHPAPEASRLPVPGAILLGTNKHHGEVHEVFLSPEDRVRHTHVIGASGTGKTTFLFNCIRQDIENGSGISVIDPHGDLIEAILAIIPEERIADVIVLDPGDEVASVALNIFSAATEAERMILASDLVSVFERLSTSWGDQMNTLLRNAILAFLDSDRQGTRQGTLADLRRFLIDDSFRKDFLHSVGDPELLFFWNEVYPQFGPKTSVGSVVNRLDAFLGPKPLRYIVSQRRSTLDFSAIMDGGKIFLCRLSQGVIGKENAYLLGSLIVTKLQQAAMGRQRIAEHERRDHWLYIDEFQNFITPSMAEILTEARKYRLGLILAHQTLAQLERNSEVANAVVGTTNVRAVFRVGDDDAKSLARGFAHFELEDIQSLETGHAICRVGRSDHDFNFTVPFPAKMDATAAETRRQRVVAASREHHSTPREAIEAELLAALESKAAESETVAGQSRKSKVSTEEPRVALPLPDEAPEVVETERDTGVKGTEGNASNEASPSADTSLPTLDPAEAPLGKGGADHRAMQKLIKSAAQFVGFKATIEEDIGDGMSVDVVVEDDQQRIAIEISVSTPTSHEIGNIRKCLEAGFHHVIFACPDAGKLDVMSKLVSREFAEASNVHCVLTGHVGDVLRLAKGSLAASTSAQTASPGIEAPAPPKPGMTLLHSIKETNPKLAAEKKKAAFQKIIEAMKKKPADGDS